MIIDVARADLGQVKPGGLIMLIAGADQGQGLP